jgi:hypothetical protein
VFPPVSETALQIGICYFTVTSELFSLLAGAAFITSAAGEGPSLHMSYQNPGRLHLRREEGSLSLCFLLVVVAVIPHLDAVTRDPHGGPGQELPAEGRCARGSRRTSRTCEPTTVLLVEAGAIAPILRLRGGRGIGEKGHKRRVKQEREANGEEAVPSPFVIDEKRVAELLRRQVVSVKTERRKAARKRKRDLTAQSYEMRAIYDPRKRSGEEWSNIHMKGQSWSDMHRKVRDARAHDAKDLKKSEGEKREVASGQKAQMATRDEAANLKMRPDGKETASERRNKMSKTKQCSDDLGNAVEEGSRDLGNTGLECGLCGRRFSKEDRCAKHRIRCAQREERRKKKTPKVEKKKKKKEKGEKKKLKKSKSRGDGTS